jgi:hypothetical protein
MERRYYARTALSIIAPISPAGLDWRDLLQRKDDRPSAYQIDHLYVSDLDVNLLRCEYGVLEFSDDPVLKCDEFSRHHDANTDQFHFHFVN